MAGRNAARIDRLPLTRVQWELALITQLAWGVIVATDGIAARLYPFIWLPHHTLSSFQYSTLYAFEVGVGILIGDYVMGFFADHYGRKPAMVVSAILAGLFIWPFAIVTNFWVLLVFSILGTLGVGGILATNVVYMTEVISPEVRGRVTLASQALALVTLSVLAALLPFFMIPDHYRPYIYLLAVLQFLLVPLLAWRLPESPRWLEAKGRAEAADRELTRLEQRCVHQGGVLPEPDPAHHPVIAAEHAPFLELFRGEYAKRTLMLLVCWILGYGGIVYGFGAYALVYITDRGHDAHFVFLTYFIGSMLGAGLLIANSFIAERVERRDAILVGAALFAGALFAVYATSGTAFLVFFYWLAGIGEVVWLWNMYGYTANSFPTRLRAIGTGWTDGLGHLGAWGGSVLAGTLFTVGPDHLGWIVLVAVPGALIPALIIRGLGLKQRKAVLEQLAT
jgi:putative MFS transporter